MRIDTVLLQQQLQNVTTDKDAANLLFAFVDKPLVQAQTEADYLVVVNEIPPKLRCLYFVIYMDIGVCADGFPGFICAVTYDGMCEDISRGLHLIGAVQLEGILREAIAYLDPLSGPELSELTFYDMDKQTGDIHGRYFQFNGQLIASVGRYMRHHAATLFDADGA